MKKIIEPNWANQMLPINLAKDSIPCRALVMKLSDWFNENLKDKYIVDESELVELVDACQVAIGPRKWPLETLVEDTDQVVRLREALKPFIKESAEDGDE